MQHLMLALVFLSEVFRSSCSHPSHFPQDQDISSPLSVEDGTPHHLLNSSSPPYPLHHPHQCSSFMLTQGQTIQRETSLSGRWNGPYICFSHTIRVFAIFPQSATSAFSRNPRQPRFRVIRILQFSEIKSPLSSKDPPFRSKEDHIRPLVWTHRSSTPTVSLEGFKTLKEGSLPTARLAFGRTWDYGLHEPVFAIDINPAPRQSTFFASPPCSDHQSLIAFISKTGTPLHSTNQSGTLFQTVSGLSDCRFCFM